MKTRQTVLVVDNDSAICNYFESLLGGQFTVIKARSEMEARTAISVSRPSLVLVDLFLDSGNEDACGGLDFCSSLKNAPDTRNLIIFVYSNSNELDHLSEAFARGADDYVLKTIRPRELIARVAAKLDQNRSREQELELEGTIGALPALKSLKCGNLVLEMSRLQAKVDGEALKLSVLEFRLLYFLVRNQNRVVDRQFILSSVWKDSAVSDRTIDTHMVYLRKKLKKFDQTLGTVYGAGYILRVDPPSRSAEDQQL